MTEIDEERYKQNEKQEKKKSGSKQLETEKQLNLLHVELIEFFLFILSMHAQNVIGHSDV